MPRIFAFVAALLLVLGGSSAALAQEGTPPPDGGMPPFSDQLFADMMGLPEIAVTVTDTAIEGVPSELAAGMYVVTVTNQAAEGGLLEFVQLTDGRTIADVEAIAGPTAMGGDEAPGAAGTPMAGMMMEGTPMAGMEGGASPFDWLYDAYAPGGVAAFFPDQTAQAVVNLTPGDYVAYSGPETPQAPVALTVTGDAASPMAGGAMTADLTVTETGTNEGYDIEFEGELAAGQSVLEITNDTDQPHFLIIFQSPGPVTEEQLNQLITIGEGTPVPEGMPNPDEFLPAAYAGTQSVDTTQYLAVDLQPGTYIAACFIPDRENPEVDHAMEGLLGTFTVE